MLVAWSQWRMRGLGQTRGSWACPKRDRYDSVIFDYYPKGMKVWGDQIFSIFFEK